MAENIKCWLCRIFIFFYSVIFFGQPKTGISLSDLGSFTDPEKLECANTRVKLETASAADKTRIYRLLEEKGCRSHFYDTCNELDKKFKEANQNLQKACTKYSAQFGVPTYAPPSRPGENSCETEIRKCIDGQTAIKTDSFTGFAGSVATNIASAGLMYNQKSQCKITVQSTKKNLEKDRDKLKDDYKKTQDDLKDMVEKVGDKKVDNIKGAADLAKEISETKAEGDKLRVDLERGAQKHIKEALDARAQMTQEVYLAENKIAELMNQKNNLQSLYRKELRSLYKECRDKANQAVSQFEVQRDAAQSKNKLQFQDVNQALFYAASGKKGIDNVVYRETYSACVRNQDMRDSILESKDKLRTALEQIEAQAQEIRIKTATIKDQLQRLDIDAKRELDLLDKATVANMQANAQKLFTLSAQQEQLAKAQNENFARLQQQEAILQQQAQYQSSALNYYEGQIVAIKNANPGLDDKAVDLFKDQIEAFVDRNSLMPDISQTCCQGKTARPEMPSALNYTCNSLAGVIGPAKGQERGKEK